MTAVVIVQRQTVDWRQLSDDAFREQSIRFCRLWGKPDDYVWRLFQLWNSTFLIDYRRVRHELKSITHLNIQSARQTVFYPYAPDRKVPPSSAYYVFLDDDDWVDPDIGEHLKEKISVFSQPPPLLLWRSANIGSPNQEHVVFVWGMNGRCMTNNYAVHGQWLDPFSKMEQVFQHKDAARLFESTTSVPHLDCTLTVSNKSPISSVSLDRGLDGDFSPRRLVAMVENYVERMSRIQNSELVYMPWSRPLVDKTLQIFESVLDSRRQQG